MNEAKRTAIEYGKGMGWDVPENVVFFCDECRHVEECHLVFDPCNMILEDETTCLSESMRAEWTRRVDDEC